VYLGSIFTKDGSIRSAVTKHCEDKRKHLLKFVNFLNQNPDCPFRVKLRVFNACFTAAIIYGCESWFDVNVSKVEKLYLSAIKSLLGVRITTINEACLVELGLPRLLDVIKQKQLLFLRNVVEDRNNMIDDPLMFVLRLVNVYNTPTSRYIQNLKLSNENFVQKSLDNIKRSICVSDKTKLKTYVMINQTLSSPELYVIDIPEHVRVVVTRLRVSAHNLRIETGRWARIPQNERLCVCNIGLVQDEKHIIVECPMVEDVRIKYGFVNPNFEDIVKCDTVAKCYYLYEIYKRFCD
jgi:hypothetical protein